jgi:hypothetical protein
VAKPPAGVMRFIDSAAPNGYAQLCSVPHVRTPRFRIVEGRSGRI